MVSGDLERDQRSMRSPAGMPTDLDTAVDRALEKDRARLDDGGTPGST